MELDVLMPFHRIDNYLSLALQSLVQNKSINFKLIAIDDRIDQSSDIRSIFQNIKNLEIVKTEGGTGYGNSLKIGTKLIQAEACALMNSDDLVHPQRFSRQLDAINNADLCITKIQRINAKNRLIKSLAGSISSEKYHPIYLLFGSYGADASWCMRTSWWKKNSFFDQDECLDWRIGMEAFNKSNVVMLNDKLYFYRKHKSQVTSNRYKSIHQMDTVYEVWKKFAESYGIINCSRSIFDFMAVPWNFNSSVNYDLVMNWVSLIENYTSNLDYDISNNVNELILRRYIFGFIDEKNSARDRFQFSLKGKAAVLPLFTDSIGNFLRF